MKIIYSKALFTFILFLIVFAAQNSNGQNWEWAKEGAGYPINEGLSVTTDHSGNVYITGTFHSTITFNGTTLTQTNDGWCLFLVKYDSSGNVIWAKTTGGTCSDVGTSVTTDKSGNVYVTGSYWYNNVDSPLANGTIFFDTVELLYTSGFGSESMFLVKYDSSGNVIWAKGAGDQDDVEGTVVNTDNSGNVYLTGGYDGPSLTLGTITLTNAVSSVYEFDMFLAKYDSSGNVLWATGPANGTAVVAHAVTIDASEHIYVLGGFYNRSVIFGTDTLINTGYIGNYNATDVFLVKYDSLGNVLWAKCAGGNLGGGFGGTLPTSVCSGAGITTDPVGNVYITGEFSDSMTLGAITLADTTSNMFLAKYDPSGNTTWARKATGSNTVYSITSDDTGNIFISGNYRSSITFGTTTLNNGNDTIYSLFLVKYDTSGNAVSVNTASCDKAYPYSISCDPANNIYVAGLYNSPDITFSTTTLINTPPYGDMFLAKLKSNLPNNTRIQIINKEKIDIYPNPAHTYLRISATYNITTIVIANLLGQTVYSNRYNASQVQVDVAELPTGVYFVKVNEEVRKFVKQ